MSVPGGQGMGLQSDGAGFVDFVVPVELEQPTVVSANSERKLIVRIG